MPGINDGSNQQNAFEWDHTQYPGGTRVFGATVSPYETGNTQDWWAVYLLAGTTCVFQTRLPTAWQTQLYLYDSNGYYLQFSSSGGDDGYSLSKITYAVTQDGWYFLALTGYVYSGGFGPYALESVPAPKSFKTYATSVGRFSTRAPAAVTVPARFGAVKDPVIAVVAARSDIRQRKTVVGSDRFSQRRSFGTVVASRLSLQKITTATSNLCRLSVRAQTTGRLPSRFAARANATNQMMSRFDIRARATQDVPSRFSMAARASAQQIARHNAFIPPGWRLYARNTTTGSATFLGFIPIDADPRKLTDVAIPDGAFEIEVRPEQYFWQDTRTRPITTLITNAVGEQPPIIGLPAIQNLRAAIIGSQTVISWNVSTDIIPAAGQQFGLWFAGTTPVDTSGPPDSTVALTQGVGEYQVTRQQSAAEFVAVRAIAGITQGPVTELFLPWNGDVVGSPANQLATDAPIVVP